MNNFEESMIIKEIGSILANWQYGPKNRENFLEQMNSLRNLGRSFHLKNLDQSITAIQEFLPDVSIENIDTEAIFEHIEIAILKDIPTILSSNRSCSK